MIPDILLLCATGRLHGVEILEDWILPNIIIPVLIFSAIYGLEIFGCIVLLRIMGVSAKWRIVLGFLIFGTVTGFLVILLWPQDNMLLVNLPAGYIGFQVYIWSIQLFGNPNSFNAHETIPWLLRIPQVYMLVSILFWGALGSVIQIAVNRWSSLHTSARKLKIS